MVLRSNRYIIEGNIMWIHVDMLRSIIVGYMKKVY